MLISFTFKYSLCDECPRNKPILKNKECSSIFCTAEEFKSGVCQISNSFIETQWLNNIHTFLSEGISHVWATSDSKGDVFLISQGFTAGNAGDKYIYAFQKDGNGYFYYYDYELEDNVINYSFEDIFLPDNEYSEIFYTIEIKDRQYLLSTQTGNEMVLIDWYNDDFLIFKLNSSSFFSNSLFPLKGFNDEDDEKIYFNDFVYCKEYLTYNDCFLGFRVFNISMQNITTLHEKIEENVINSKAKIDCFQNEDLYIQCIYTIKERDENGKETYNRVLSLFNNEDLKMEYNEILQEDCNFDNTFDSTIQLSGNIFVTGFSFSDERNIIKLLLKKIVSNSNSEEKKFKLENYISDIDYININEDNQYSIYKGLAKRNTLVKISESKFAILLNEFSDEEINEQYDSFNKYLLILIVNIIDNSKISIRHYKINFDLYNLIILEDLRGYTLNNFFGVLIETGVKASSYTTKAIFLTFGYVNSTLESDFVDKNLKLNNTNSIIRLGDLFSDIENNLFAYKFIGVRILHLPVKKSSGYFINTETNEEIKEENLLSLDTVLRFILVREIITEKNIFSIDFAAMVKEPDFDLMNQNAERVDIYPNNNTELEREFYSPREIEARVVKYRFYLGCYENCNGCYKITNNPDDQQCMKCKENHYFIEGTQNCFFSKEGYYLNEETYTFFPCKSPCNDCDPPNDDEPNKMQCISCKEGYTLYDSTNCLKCDKYVNYEMTECIDEIPEGYYLQNETLGIIEKCHNLCKTCKSGPRAWTMNCLECKYKNSNYEPIYEGNCPTEDGIFDEEEETTMPGGECPRNKPILVRNDFCFMGYCSPEEYQNELCVIKNSIIEEQWMNRIQRFGEGNILFVNADYGTNQELFLIGQKRENETNVNIIYGCDKYGGPLFYDKNENEYTFYKTIEFPNDLFLDRIKYVTNYEAKKSFLLSTQLYKCMYEINYEEDKTIIHDFNNIAVSSDNIIALKNHPGEYITYFTYCQNEVDFDYCYPYFRKFTFESETNEIKILREKIADVNINVDTKLICIEDYGQYILCSYTEIDDQFLNHGLGLFKIENFDKALASDIELIFDKYAFFDDMINLNDEAFVYAFSKEKNIIQVIIKTYIYVAPYLGNYIENVDYINLNEEPVYDFIRGSSNRNSLCKINDNKFAILVNSFNDIPEDTFENPNIVIYIFNIFNKHKNVNIRRYSINFKLYNMFNYGKILGYNLGDFFGILIELSSPDNNLIKNSAFMTFGYVNSTGPTVIYDKEFIVENSLESKSITLGYFIGDIENNLFGYDSLSVIILSLPDEDSGYLAKYNNEKIQAEELISKSAQIKLILNDNYKAGNYSFFFAGVVKEPYYDKMNKYSEGKILSYPNNSNVDEKDYYTPQILIGKRIEFKFEIKGKGESQDDEECYPSCLDCYSKTTDENDHQCKICKPGYYFKEDTYNCYKEIKEYYYFNEIDQIFSPCYIDCLTCSNKDINSTYMNCLSCESTYKFYEKSTNCLNCPKYINYLQTECIDQVPEGYYISDTDLGTIEKCHDLCKTCNGPPFDKDTRLFMNCITCKYRNKDQSNIPNLDGNCPSSEEEEKDDEPIDGQCPREKPILRNNKCYKIFCSEEEFKQGICKIYNKYVQKQWLNNFHSFANTSTYIDYDIDEKGNLFLLAQKIEEPNYNHYLYGFSPNGAGLFYDKDKNKYTSFRKITYQFSNYIENIKYIEINNEGYMLSILRDKQIYLYDLNNYEIYIHSFFYIPFSIDKIIKLKNKENTYLFDFIYCVDEVFSNCYIGFSNYKIEKKNSFILEKTNSEELIKVGYSTKLTCFENSYNHIQCKYTIEKETTHLQIITLFNRDTFEVIQDFILDEFNFDFPTFDSMIELNDNGFVVAYSIDPNIIHVLIKKITLNSNNQYELGDYLYNISYININEDSTYDFTNGNRYRNHFFKLSDDKFVMLINNCKDNIETTYLNNALVIIIFHIYNFNKNVILRHYKIDFAYYNMYIDGDIMGYNLGGFFGTIIELTSPNERYIEWASFLTFGYVNATEDISSEEGTNNLITNKKNIKLNDYITGIENNLFGYEFIGVKILSLPDENKAGYFININENNKKINLNETLDIKSELKFVIKDSPTFGDYYISFAGVVKEPEYQESNNLATKVEYYPSSDLPEKYYDEQDILIGKEFKYNFSIKEKKEESKCFKNCETCIRPSDNINEQDCLTCKKHFYFKDGTQNCYDKIEYQYYFNSETQTFSPCYKDCYTCSTKEIDSTHMNCFSCHKLYKFYEKSKNCLKCPKYVNYLQTECIETIPNGYFLLDSDNGIIGKCHFLCSTCKAEPITINNELHMNCETCKYGKANNLIEGNCPFLPQDKEEGDDSSGISSTLIWVSIILLILIVIMSGIIIYIKCFKNEGNKRNNTDYFNIGKDIPFEDENSFGINS